jgi:iron-sulfur cluster assembly protein
MESRMTSEQRTGLPSTTGGVARPEGGVTLSERAAKHVASLLAAEKRHPDEYGLRIRIVSGGCPALLHTLALDRLRDGDESFEHEGIRVIIDRRSLTLMHGTILDYERTDTSEGFRIQNPNPLNRPCRCGMPFSV